MAPPRRDGSSIVDRADSFCQQCFIAPECLRGCAIPARAPGGGAGTLGHRFQRLDPIGAEMPVAIAQFAPRDDHADAVEERQRKRPDDAPGRRVVAVGVDDLEFAFGPDGGANGRQLGIACCDRLAGSDQKVCRIKAGLEVIGQHGGDLRKRVARGVAEGGIGAIRHPS
jgi:hypothetical protein